MHSIFYSSSLQPLGDSLPDLPDTSLVLGQISDYRERLFDEEKQALQDMAEVRQISFSSGRHYAHRALEAIGERARPITRRDRVPVWPAGSVGSISHSPELAVAIASNSAPGIGVDVERAGRVDQRMFRMLFTENEQRYYHQDLSLATVAFSAKEAGYKSIYPSAQTYIGFKEAEIHWLSEGRFSINYLGQHKPNCALNQGIGYWCRHEHHILTVFTLSRETLK